MGEFKPTSQSYFEQACDLSSIWNLLFFGSTPQSPTSSAPDEKVQESISFVEGPAASEDDRRRMQEDEFKKWLSTKYPSSNQLTRLQSVKSIKISSPAESSDHAAEADREKDIEEARQRHRQEEIYRIQKENEFLNEKNQVEAKSEPTSVWQDISSSIGLNSVINSAATPTFSSNSGQQRLQKSATLSSSYPGPAAIAGSDNERIDRFERLLDTQGIQVTLQLPKNGSVKAKRAILRCDRDSSCISIEIVSRQSNLNDNTTKIKKLKFEVKEILLVAKGKGSSVAFDKNLSDDKTLRLIVHNKPELNMELDDVAVRDAVVSGLMGLISRRRAKLGGNNM